MKKSPLKAKVAIFFAYNGSKYHGLQKVDNNLPTIEGALEQAMNSVGLIPNFNFGNLQKSSWGRGSRTDKGVHASLNTIKCKIFVSEKFQKKEEDFNLAQAENFFNSKIAYDLIIKEINAVIDKDIKVFAIRPVVAAFDLKQSAKTRKYEYILPVSILKTKNNVHPPSELLKSLNSVLSSFKGSHNFHNYTAKGDSNDQSNQRFILDIRAEFLEIEIEEKKIDPEDFAIVYIHGQSFVYNQIRKMIGAALQVIHLELGEGFIPNTFLKNKIDIWLAPSEGLLLDRVDLLDFL